MNRFALHGATVLLVAFAGCTGLLADDPPRDERAVAALEDASNALDDVETYRYETDLHVEATGDGRTERVDARVRGAVDRPARRMNSTTEADGRTLSAYVVDRTVYRQCARPRGFWGVENRSVEEWDGLTPAYRQLSLLQTGGLRWEGRATVDGRNASHLVGEPTADALRQYSEEGSRPLFGGPTVRDVTMEAWIDDETDLPIATTLRFEVVQDGNTATAAMETRYRAYGEPVPIEVPREALEDPLELGCPGE